MPCRAYFSIASVVLVGLPSVALAAAENADDRASPWLTLLIFFAPVFLVILLFLVVIRKSGAMSQGQYLVKAGDHMERANAHMERIEQKTDRMIELLESIERKLPREDA